MLYLDDDSWQLACKEITHQVTRTWFFPRTNVQSISSAYFIDLEDLVSYADSKPYVGTISLDILEFAANHLDHSVVRDEERTFETYLHQVSAAAESLLEPIYKKFVDKIHMYEDALKIRLASSAAGESTPKSMLPTATPDQLLDRVACAPLLNCSPAVGLDIGTTPNQAMTEHLNLLAISSGPDSNKDNLKPLPCWAWCAWDYYVHCVERRLILDAMEGLTRRYVKGRALSDVLNELIDIRADTDGLIRESQSFADAWYKTEADRIIEGSGGRDKSLEQYAGKFARFLRGKTVA
jgi:hypothetical protein